MSLDWYLLMSLDWYLTGIKDYKEVCWDGDNLSAITHQLIMCTIGAGITHVTERNAGEFYARVTVMQMVHGGDGWISVGRMKCKACGHDLEKVGYQLDGGELNEGWEDEDHHRECREADDGYPSDLGPHVPEMEWTNRFITMDEVRQHIGLRTNASPLTRAKFLSSQVAGGMDAMVRQFNQGTETA